MIKLICTLEPTKINWLSQFVAHYRNLGVDRFLLSLQQEPSVAAETRLTRRTCFENTLRELGITQSFELLESYDSASMCRHHQRIADQFVTKDDWVVWCDSDEFQRYPLPLGEVVHFCLAQGIEAIPGILIDRIAADGSLPDFDPSRPIWDVFSRPCNVTGSIARGTIEKVAFARGDIRLQPGNHATENPNTKCLPQAIPIHHFKWHAGVLEQLRFRLDPAWKRKCFWWIESQLLLDYFSRNNMRFNLNDVPVIVLPASGVFDAGYSRCKPTNGWFVKPTTVILQVYESTDLPIWIERCIGTVKQWSEAKGFAYKFLREGFFSRSPDWFRERCGAQTGPVTDLSRVLLMQDLFDEGYETVIWIDADVLIFDAPTFKIEITKGFLAIYEVTLHVRTNGEVNVTGPTVNGAVLGAVRDHPVLNFYRHAIEETVRNFPHHEIPRTVAGPTLLTRIAQIVPLECITTVGLFTPAMLQEIAQGGDRLCRIFSERFGYAVAAANLCHFFRGEIVPAQRQALDQLTLLAIERLLETRGAYINRFLSGK